MSSGLPWSPGSLSSFSRLNGNQPAWCLHTHTHIRPQKSPSPGNLLWWANYFVSGRTDRLKVSGERCESRLGSLTGKAPAWLSSPWQSGWRRSRNRRHWARSRPGKWCRPSPASPDSAPPRSGSLLPGRSSGRPGWRGLPEAAGFEARAGSSEQGAVLSRGWMLPVGDCRKAEACRQQRLGGVFQKTGKRNEGAIFGLTNACSTGEHTAAATTLNSWGGNKAAWCSWVVLTVERADSSCKHTH